MDEAATNQLTSFAKNASDSVSSKLTTSNGAPIDSLTASTTAGSRGPIVLQDFSLIDHIAHFDRERIPERVVHAKGSGGFGYFQVTNDISSICKADMFKGIGKKTPISIRFSTVGGEVGTEYNLADDSFIRFEIFRFLV